MTAEKSCVTAEELIRHAYEAAQAVYGNLHLALDDYQHRLHSLLTKYLGVTPASSLIREFLSATHTTDLYLTTACAEKSEVAWQQFQKRYAGFLFDLAQYECPNREAADDLASTVFADLFFRDSSGQPRLASYDGQAPLVRWLRIVVAHRASNERQRKYQQFISLEEVADSLVEAAVQSPDSAWRASRYSPLVWHSFQDAAKQLTEREQFMLLMIYEQQLSAKEVARLLDVHPSRVSRQLQQIYSKLRQQVITILADLYQLSPAAIEECLNDILENSEYSLLEIIKAG